MFNMGIQITVRDVDPEVFRNFKADVVKSGLTLGAALNLAMGKFKAELQIKNKKFTEWESISWGKGTENISQDVDKILYGE